MKLELAGGAPEGKRNGNYRHGGRTNGLSAESEEKREPASDIDTAVVVSLKALDTERPIREADVNAAI
jgi:hypothetical protein